MWSNKLWAAGAVLLIVTATLMSDRLAPSESASVKSEVVSSELKEPEPPVVSVEPPQVSAASAPVQAPEAPAPRSYWLDIEGESPKMAPSAFRSLIEWRKKIVQFAKDHPEHMYINGPDVKKVALTFDDGPDAKVTPAVVDILNRYGVTGSFFFVGSNVKSYPQVVKRAYESGHLVLNHSYKHDDLVKLTEERIVADLKQTENEIHRVIGVTPAIMRPPYGDTDEKVVQAAEETGNAVVIWSIDSMDWSQKEKANIVRNVTEHVRNGDIMLMHSGVGSQATAEALPTIIEELQSRGFQIVGLEELLGVKAYK